MTHQDCIKQITKTISNASGTRALFLSGSYGNGHADAYSGIDFVLVTDDGATDTTAAHWRSAIEQTGEIIRWWDRTTVPTLINAITQDWTRTDVILLRPDQLTTQTQDKLNPVFDPENLYETLPTKAATPPPNAKRLRYQFEDFIRILGLLHLAAGRGEYINGVLGVFYLRNYLVELMINETNAPNRGGALHLNRLITDEQKAVLTALPPAVVEHDAMIAAHLAYANAYLPRARHYANANGVDWPETFETATWVQLRKTLGIKKPY